MRTTTIIIPCHNESQRLPSFLEELCAIAGRMEGVSIVVSDDGSNQENYETIHSKIETLRQTYPFLSLSRSKQNAGKGAAIARVALEVTSELIGFVDADGAIDAGECFRTLLTFQSKLDDLSNDGSDGSLSVIASRVKMLGYTISRSFKRHILGRVFATLLSQLYHIPVYDSQCGCKFYRTVDLKIVMPYVSDHRWLWDTQVLILMYLCGMNVIELPVTWIDVPGSKVSLLRDPIRMFFGLMKFKYHINRGQFIERLRAARLDLKVSNMDAIHVKTSDAVKRLDDAS